MALTNKAQTPDTSMETQNSDHSKGRPRARKDKRHFTDWIRRGEWRENYYKISEEYINYPEDILPLI